MRGPGGSRTMFPQFKLNNLPVFSCLHKVEKAKNAISLVQFWYSFRLEKRGGTHAASALLFSVG